MIWLQEEEVQEEKVQEDRVVLEKVLEDLAQDAEAHPEAVLVKPKG